MASAPHARREWITLNLEVNTFELGTSKEAAPKPLEEAAEAFGAWQTYSRCVCDGRFELAKQTRENLIYECCDVVQATANLMARFANSDDEIYATMRRMRESNMKRGRYGK